MTFNTPPEHGNQPYGNQPYGDYSQGQPPGWQDQQYSLPHDGFNQPPTPTKPKKNRKLLITGIIIIIAILVGTSSYILFFSGSSSVSPAEAVVLDYLHALNDNDAEKALSLGATQPQNKDFLTKEILAQQIKPGSITNIIVGQYVPEEKSSKDKGEKGVEFSFLIDGHYAHGFIHTIKVNGTQKLKNSFINVYTERPHHHDPKNLTNFTFAGKVVKGAERIQVFPGKWNFGLINPDFELTTATVRNYNEYNTFLKLNSEQEIDPHNEDQFLVNLQFFIKIKDNKIDMYRNKINTAFRDCVFHHGFSNQPNVDCGKIGTDSLISDVTSTQKPIFYGAAATNDDPNFQFNGAYISNSHSRRSADEYNGYLTYDDGSPKIVFS